jgi:16S rRNA (adenine1518-N6/adenine1519-N6)-dimethyltransferase
MQTLTEIRSLLDRASLRPQKQYGQSFLVDGNLMAKLVELAGPAAGQTVLEVGPATGSLTEELLARGAVVVAVEIDRGFCGLLRRRLGGHDRFVLIEGDVLAGKHALSAAVLDAVGRQPHLVANLPYNLATPLLAECLLQSWRSLAAGVGAGCRFERMTFTVQQEVADRITAGPGGGAYGPISVLTRLLADVQVGPALPPSAFWPRPRVSSRILRLDFLPERAVQLRSGDALMAALALAFGQRRKQIRSILRRKGAPFAAEALAGALSAAHVEPTCRAEQVTPEQYLVMANALAAT